VDAFEPGEIPSTNVNICTRWSLALVQMCVCFVNSPSSLPPPSAIFSFFFYFLISSHLILISHSYNIISYNSQSQEKITSTFLFHKNHNHTTFAITITSLKFITQESDIHQPRTKNQHWQKSNRSPPPARIVGASSSGPFPVPDKPAAPPDRPYLVMSWSPTSRGQPPRRRLARPARQGRSTPGEPTAMGRRLHLQSSDRRGTARPPVALAATALLGWAPTAGGPARGRGDELDSMGNR
jgi:hypothetical protein